MTQAPQWKVFDAYGKYQAACKEVEAAAALMGFYGEGATIRFDHGKWATVWTEGRESQDAGESFDHVAEVASARRFNVQAEKLRAAGLGHLVP